MDLEDCKDVCRFHFGNGSVKYDLGEISFELNPFAIVPMAEFVVIIENNGGKGAFSYTLMGDEAREYSEPFYSTNELSNRLADLLRKLRS
jgi:glycosyltransferase involved in cell wall biosynthesis